MERREVTPRPQRRRYTPRNPDELTGEELEDFFALSGEEEVVGEGVQGDISVVEHHYLQQLPRKADERMRQKVCQVCHHSTRRATLVKRVTTWCESCGVGLCIGECFRDYHSLKNY